MYPQRLFHTAPAWVPDRSTYHIRIRTKAGGPALTDPHIAPGLLDSARDYVNRQRWSCYLLVLMPDHLHALLGFGKNQGMSETIRNWKRGQTRFLKVCWQDNFFDHRIRNPAEYSETFAYLERNPVAKGLCKEPADWPHRLTCLHPEVVPGT